MKSFNIYSFLLILICAASTLTGQMTKKSESGPFVLRNGTIHTISHGVISGDILIENERIKSIGPNLNVNGFAKEIDCSGFDIYPGFIDGGTHLGLSEIENLSLTNDFREQGNFTPHMDALKAVNPNSVNIPVTRTNGITTVITYPSGGMFTGQAALIDLHGYTPQQMYGGFKGSVLYFPSTGRVSPRDRRSATEIKNDGKKKIKALDDIWDKLELYIKIDSAGAVLGQKQNAYNPEMEALKNIILKKDKLLVEVNKDVDIISAINWLKKRKIDAILTGVQEGWKVADSIKASELDVITGPVLSKPGREYDRYDVGYKNAGLLHQAGIKVALRTNEIENVRNLPFNAGFAAAYGMGKEAALRSITLTAAEILDMDSDYGSIDEGKVANLFICKGDPLEPKTKISHLFIRGWKIPMENRHTLLYEEFLSRSPGISGE